MPEIIEWARGPMAALTAGCLDDPRVTLGMGDVSAFIDDAADGTTGQYDAILLDVDNGPDGLVRARERADLSLRRAARGQGRAGAGRRAGGVVGGARSGVHPAAREGGLRGRGSRSARAAERQGAAAHDLVRAQGLRAMARLILFNKPYGVLSQFTDRGADAARRRCPTSSTCPASIPPGGSIATARACCCCPTTGGCRRGSPIRGSRRAKTYLVQVEGEPDEASLDRLREGVPLKDGPTRPAEVERIAAPDAVAARSADPLPQERARQLAAADDPRRPQPAGAADDRGGRPSDAAAGALVGSANGRSTAWRPANGAKARQV